VKITLSPRPANLEALAFEPVWMLAERLRTKQISSTELTTMYLSRLKRHAPTRLRERDHAEERRVVTLQSIQVHRRQLGR